MAKDKEKQPKHEPLIKSGDKYLCPHCKAEIPMNQPCPTCHLQVDWTKI